MKENGVLMNLVFDLSFVVIIAIGLLAGWTKGFISFFIKPLRLIGSFIVASVYGRTFSESFLRNRLEPVVSDKVADAFRGSDTGYFFTKLCENVISDTTVSVANDNSSDFIAAVSSILTDKISFFVSLVLLFVVSSIVISFFFALFKSGTKKGAIGLIDHSLGLVLGGVVVFLLFLGFVRILDSGLFGDVIADNAQTGIIYPFLQKFNLLEFLQNTIRKI